MYVVITSRSLGFQLGIWGSFEENLILRVFLCNASKSLFASQETLLSCSLVMAKICFLLYRAHASVLPSSSLLGVGIKHGSQIFSDVRGVNNQLFMFYLFFQHCPCTGVKGLTLVVLKVSPFFFFYFHRCLFNIVYFSTFATRLVLAKGAEPSRQGSRMSAMFIMVSFVAVLMIGVGTSTDFILFYIHVFYCFKLRFLPLFTLCLP